MEQTLKTKIEILGPGCTRCKETYRVVQTLVETERLPFDVVKVESDRADGRAGPDGDAGGRHRRQARHLRSDPEGRRDADDSGACLTEMAA